jgi:hypothetical protein
MSEHGETRYFCHRCEIADHSDGSEGGDRCAICGERYEWVWMTGGGITAQMTIALYDQIRNEPGILERIKFHKDRTLPKCASWPEGMLRCSD